MQSAQVGSKIPVSAAWTAPLFHRIGARTGHHQPPHVLRVSENPKYSTLANAGVTSRKNPMAHRWGHAACI